MKKVLILILIAFGIFSYKSFSVAQAQERDQISDLTAVSFDGRTLSYSYVVGTAPSEHETIIELDVKIEHKKDYSYISDIVVNMFDVSESSGKGYFTKEGQVNLSELIRKKLKAMDLPEHMADSPVGYTVKLPDLHVR